MKTLIIILAALSIAASVFAYSTNFHDRPGCVYDIMIKLSSSDAVFLLCEDGSVRWDR